MACILLENAMSLLVTPSTDYHTSLLSQEVSLILVKLRLVSTASRYNSCTCHGVFILSKVTLYFRSLVQGVRFCTNSAHNLIGEAIVARRIK